MRVKRVVFFSFSLISTLTINEGRTSVCFQTVVMTVAVSNLVVKTFCCVLLWNTASKKHHAGARQKTDYSADAGSFFLVFSTLNGIVFKGDFARGESNLSHMLVFSLLEHILLGQWFSNI